jgi:hypothetical protein
MQKIFSAESINRVFQTLIIALTDFIELLFDVHVMSRRKKGSAIKSATQKRLSSSDTVVLVAAYPAVFIRMLLNAFDASVALLQCSN